MQTGMRMPNKAPQSVFKTWAESWLASKLKPVLEDKGSQYSGDSEPALINFMAGSDLMDLPLEQYLLTMANKHWYALVRWAKTPHALFSEKDRSMLSERISDIIVYLLLLVFWVSGTEEEPK